MNKKWMLCAISLACVFALVIGIKQVSAVPAISSGIIKSAQPVIVIDPGHGGMDGGAVGIDNIIEKDINLSLSLCLADFFRLSGYQVVMTRETDCSIHDEGISGARKQKVSDLHNRLAIMNQYPDGIVLCIHQNQFTQSKYSGGQVFYGTQQSEASSRLAQTIQTNLNNMLQTENNREIKEAYDTLFLMRNAPSTAVLVECGFLSNPEEAHLLVQPEYQQKMAFVIYTSTLQFLQEEI